VKKISKHTSVCAIDRILFCNPDYDRCADILAQELHTALTKLHNNRKRSYVLVAHYYGSIVSMMYNTMFPGEVSGLVLVDPAHPDMFDRFPTDMWLSFVCMVPLLKIFQFLSPFGFSRFAGVTTGLSFPPTKVFPKKMANELHMLMTYDKWRAAIQEVRGLFSFYRTFKKKLPEVQQAQKNLPVTVITATHRIYGPSFYPDEVTDVFKSVHTDYLSSKGHHVMAEKSDHWAQVQEPELVIDCVLEVLNNI